VIELPTKKWLGALTPADQAVLAHAAAPVLDVGCGPGRHVAALARRGVMALGIDVAPGALRLARDQGAAVLQRSIFERVPGAGHWGSALLLDGNIGIGGDPHALLCRIRDVLDDDGVVLAEVDPPGCDCRRTYARLEKGPLTTDWFPWATVGADGVAGLAADCGFALRESWTEEGYRWFAKLAKL
jgi:SAM-dependent methyltransferase